MCVCVLHLTKRSVIYVSCNLTVNRKLQSLYTRDKVSFHFNIKLLTSPFLAPNTFENWYSLTGLYAIRVAHSRYDLCQLRSTGGLYTVS